MLVEQYFEKEGLVTITANQFYSLKVNKNLLVVIASVILIVVILIVASIPRIRRFVSGNVFYVFIVIFFYISLISVLGLVKLL